MYHVDIIILSWHVNQHFNHGDSDIWLIVISVISGFNTI